MPLSGLLEIVTLYKEYFNSRYPCTTDENDAENMPPADKEMWDRYNSLLLIYNQITNKTMDVLAELKKVNELRSEQSFNTPLSTWSLSQWSNAIAGETGELCNIIKKVERGDYHKRSENASDNPEYNNAYAAAQYREEIGKEAADIVIYLDLLCTREGLDLGAEIVKKFNEVSNRVKSPIKIPT